jgi:hypothetical protein
VKRIVELLGYQRPILHNNIDCHIINKVNKGINLYLIRDRKREASTRNKLNKSLVIGLLIHSGLEILLLLYITTFFACLLLTEEAFNRALNYNLFLRRRRIYADTVYKKVFANSIISRLRKGILLIIEDSLFISISYRLIPV